MELKTANGAEKQFRSAMIDGTNKQLALLSWALVLDRLALAVRDQQLAAEIGQLRGLAVREDEAAFWPLHSEDTAATFPRRLQGYYRLVDHVVDARGVPGGWMSTRGARATATRNFYGRYFRFPGIAGFLFLCVHLRLWGRRGETPIWLAIGRNVPVPPGALTGDRSPSRDDTHPAYRFVPIRLRTGVEYEDVLADVVSQVSEIHDLASRPSEGNQLSSEQGG